MQIYIGNIPSTASTEDLKEHFSRYGAESAKIIKDRTTGRRGGFGFIELPAENVQKAIDEMNDTEFMGSLIGVRHAERRAPGNATEKKDAWKYKNLDRYR